MVNRIVCMSNLKSIGGAVTLYKAENNGRWPWIHNVISDWSSVPTGTNRDRDPSDAPNDPGDRSVTSLMFLLVREGQPVKLFICPSDDVVVKDEDLRDETTVADDEEVGEFYWDFSSDLNCSYSWQAPIRTPGGYVNGISDDDNDTVVIADKTPAYTDPNWQPDAIADGTSPSQVRANLSQNHSGGKHANILYVDMSVKQVERPDVGNSGGNIYTASSRADGGSRSATSLRLLDHLSTRDSFLIGPIRDDEAEK